MGWWKKYGIGVWLIGFIFLTILASIREDVFKGIDMGYAIGSVVLER